MRRGFLSNGTKPVRNRPVVVCGPYGSGSTWAFNVCREIALRHVGREFVSSGLATTAIKEKYPDEWPVKIKQLVVKSHGQEALAFVNQHDARLLLTMRDPRDCALSMMRRTGMSLATAGKEIERFCALWPDLLKVPGVSMLTYENRPFDKQETMAEICKWLEMPIHPNAQGRIFLTYRTANMSNLGKLLTLSGGAPRDEYGNRFDIETLYQENHIGGARSYEWSHLPLQQRLALNRWMLDKIVPVVGDQHFPYVRNAL